MSVVVLDASPLGILANPRNPPHVVACRRWVADLQAAGWRVILPEIADYEVRRELLHRNSVTGLANLDWLAGQLEYLPLSTAAMRQAAEFWAAARRAGLPTSAPVNWMRTQFWPPKRSRSMTRACWWPRRTSGT